MYVLMKLKFFDLLIYKNQLDQAENFYFEHFRDAIKDSRKNWKKKEDIFLKMLKNPIVIKNRNILDKNYEPFILNFNRCLYIFLAELCEKNKNSNQEDFYLPNSTKFFENLPLNENFLDFSKNEASYNLINKEKKDDIINLTSNDNHENESLNNNHELCANNRDIEIKELSQFSTKEEFSDYEDEVEAYVACRDANLNPDDSINVETFKLSNRKTYDVFNVHNRNNKADYILTPQENKYFPVKFYEDKKDDPIQINPEFLNFVKNDVYKLDFPNDIFKDLSQSNSKFEANLSAPRISNALVPFINDHNCNYYLYQKQILPRPFKKALISPSYKLPLLKSFKPKYTKRENIDKKIIRRFKIFLKEKYKQKKNILDNKDIDKSFWIIFINGNILPPMKYCNNDTKENVEFKSFNSQYLLWLFSKRGSKDFYTMFIEDSGNSIIASLISDYNITQTKEIDELHNYMNNLPFIFDISSIGNNIVNKELSNYNESAPFPVINDGCENKCEMQNKIPSFKEDIFSQAAKLYFENTDL